MQHINGKKVLGIVRKVINYIKTHGEGYVVFWIKQNRKIASVNELADFANRVRRKGTKISTSGPMERRLHNWSVRPTREEQNSPRIEKVTVSTGEDAGKVTAVVKLTNEFRDFIKATGSSFIRQGEISPDKGEVKYEGETSEEVINKMEADEFLIPPEKNFSAAKKKRKRRLLNASEALAARLVADGASEANITNIGVGVDEAGAASILASPQDLKDYSSFFRLFPTITELRED
jgi:hypothetical protein